MICFVRCKEVTAKESIREVDADLVPGAALRAAGAHVQELNRTRALLTAVKGEQHATNDESSERCWCLGCARGACWRRPGLCPDGRHGAARRPARRSWRGTGREAGLQSRRRKDPSGMPGGEARHEARRGRGHGRRGTRGAAARGGSHPRRSRRHNGPRGAAARLGRLAPARTPTSRGMHGLFLLAR